MRDILKLILSDLKWYRRKRGGTWYLMAFPHPNSVAIWINIHPHPSYYKMMLKVEKYD
jgi:hypothetical protein